MIRYKYAHILMHDSVKFMRNLVESITSKTDDFNIDEHCFITPYEKTYEQIKMYPNTYLSSYNGAKLINWAAKNADWLFVHAMCDITESIKFSNYACKKIIWRTWGGQLVYRYKDGQFFKNLLKFILNYQWKRKVKRFKAIGIANGVDAICIQRVFGEKTMFHLNYSLDAMPKPIIESHKGLNVLIGHSGLENDHHIKIIDLVSKYVNEDVLFYFVLSYGNKEYCRKVEEYAKKTLGDKAVIIKEYMDIDAYQRFLQSMDIGILDGEESYALSNLGSLLYYKKTVYLNPNGIIMEAMKKDSIPCHSTSSITEYYWDDFSKLIVYPQDINSDLIPSSENKFVANWKKMLMFLSE